MNIFILLFQHHPKMINGGLLIVILSLSHVFLLFLFLEYVCKQVGRENKNDLLKYFYVLFKGKVLLFSRIVIMI